MINKKGMSAPIMLLFSVVFLISGLALFRLITADTRQTLMHGKFSQAKQNAIAGVEKSLANLKYRLENAWLGGLEQTIDGNLIHFIRKGGVPEVYISQDDVERYLSSGTPQYSDFFVEWLNDCGMHASEDITNISGSAVTDYDRAWYNITEPEVFSSTITLAVDINKTGFQSGYGANKGTLSFFYEIESTGFEKTHVDSFSKTISVKSNKSCDLDFQRESYAKYALFSTTMLKGSVATPPPVADDYVRIYSGATSVVYDGPVFAGGNLYLENNPQFSSFVYKLSTCTVQSYTVGSPPTVTDIISADLSTVNDDVDGDGNVDSPTKYALCFQNGIVNKTSIDLDTSLTENDQRNFTMIGRPAGNPKYYNNTTNNTLYLTPPGIHTADILIETDNAEVDVKYTVTFTNGTTNILIHPVTDEFVIFCESDVYVKGELSKDAKLTIATPKTIYITGDLKYSATALASGETGNTVIGLISWNENILFRLPYPAPPSTNYSAVTRQAYKLQGVYYAINGGFGVWVNPAVGTNDIMSTYNRGDDKSMGRMDHFGGVICKYVYPTLRVDPGTGGTYGFEYKSNYDDALLFEKAPPSFPGNGRYFVQNSGASKLEVLDAYHLVEN